MLNNHEHDHELQNQAATLSTIVVAFVIVGIVGWILLTNAYFNKTSPITKINYKVLGNNLMRIEWESDIPVKTKVEYGTSPLYTNKTNVSNDYSVLGSNLIVGLLPDKQHFFRIIAQDINGNVYTTKYYSSE